MFATNSPGLPERAIELSMPVVMAPVSTAFVALQTPGRRIVLASDGVYVEARSPALHVVQRISCVSLPFGAVPPALGVQLAGGPIPSQFLALARKAALAAHPDEMAVTIHWSAENGYVLRTPPQRRSGGSVTYDDTGTDETTLVVDIHSHGHHDARFSPTDDFSDRSRIGPHIAVVYGACESSESVDLSARVCAGTYLVSLAVEELMELVA
ncbi:MAG: PRTRC system protein A [Rhodanobacter sp.]